VSRLLVLLPAVPAPLDTGARIRNRGLLELLAADHDVDAIAFGSQTCTPEFAGVVRRVRIVPEPAWRSVPRRAMDLVRTELPDMALRKWSVAFRDAVRCWVRTEDYAAVQAEGIEMARYLFDVPRARRIYDAHNAEFLLQWRASETAPSLAASLYSRLQWRRLERFERRVVLSSRMSVAVSNHDANQLLALAGERATVRVVRNGIDARAYPFVRERLAGDAHPSVLFVGKLDLRPNGEALRWLVTRVLKPLQATNPGVRLFAVGADPPGWLVSAGQHDDRIAVTGYVADERPYLARCSVLVLPLHSGGGSRLKALIGMASGLPILSTRLGMEGLDAEPGEHYLVAESPEDWVACLQRLFADAGLRARLANNGRALVEQRYDWSTIRPDVHTAYAWLGT
jgi:glycosyltransferase involved in cell wall biosynthesis